MKNGDGRLLVSRAEACEMLSLSTATLIRLESAGRLRPIKPSGTVNSKVFYALAELRKLAQPKVERVRL